MKSFVQKRSLVVTSILALAMMGAACAAPQAENTSAGEDEVSDGTRDVVYLVTQALAGRARPALETHKAILRSEGYTVTEVIVPDAVTDPQWIRDAIRNNGGNNVEFAILAGRLPIPHYAGHFGTFGVPSLIYGNSQTTFQRDGGGNYVSSAGWNGDISPHTAVGILDFSREYDRGKEETLYTSYVARRLAYSKRRLVRQNSVVTDQITPGPKGQADFFAGALTTGRNWDGGNFARSATIVGGGLGALTQPFESFYFKSHGDPTEMVNLGNTGDFAGVPSSGVPFGFLASCEVGQYESDNSLAMGYLTGAGLMVIAGTAENSGIPVYNAALSFTSQNMPAGRALATVVGQQNGIARLDTGGWQPCPGTSGNDLWARDCFAREFAAYTVLGDPTLQPISAVAKPTTFNDIAISGELAPRHSPLTPLSSVAFVNNVPISLSNTPHGPQFALRLAGTEDYLTLENNGVCLNREASGALTTRTCNGASPSQQFQLRANGNLWNPASRTCVDVPNGSKTPGQTVNTYGDCDGRGNQVFNVLSSAPVVGWENSQFNGDSVLLFPGYNDTAALNNGAMNDRISAFDIPAGMSVRYYENNAYQGNSGYLTQSHAFDRDWWNDRISSVIIQ